MYNVLASEQSDYQHIMVIENAGKKYLYLDNNFQTTYPSYEYHDIMLANASEDDSVLILGGGDLTSIPYLFKKGIGNFKIVEIDKLVVDVSKIFCPVRESLWKDNVIIDDAFRFLLEAEDNSWDIVIVDLLGFVDLFKFSQLMDEESFAYHLHRVCKKYVAGFIGSEFRGLTVAAVLGYLFEKTGFVNFFPLTNSIDEVFFITQKKEALMNDYLKRYLIPHEIHFPIPSYVRGAGWSSQLAYAGAIL